MYYFIVNVLLLLLATNKRKRRKTSRLKLAEKEYLEEIATKNNLLADKRYGNGELKDSWTLTKPLRLQELYFRIYYKLKHESGLFIPQENLLYYECAKGGFNVFVLEYSADARLSASFQPEHEAMCLQDLFAIFFVFKIEHPISVTGLVANL